MPGSVNISEAQGQPDIDPDIDFSMVVIGFSTESPLPAGQVSKCYTNPSALAGDYGIGDAVDCSLHGIVVSPGNPNPPPIAICPTAATTPGAMGTIDTAGATGTAANVGLSPSTATVTNTGGAQPKGTYQILGRVADDGNGGDGTPIGTAGIMLEFSLDDGRTFLPRTALGTATVKAVLLPGAIDTGASFSFGPTTTNAALIAAAVDARAKTLAHLADDGVHLAADTSAAQVALAASSVPGTVAAAIAVLVLCDAAYEDHLPSLTAHHGPDPVNVMVLDPPETTQEAVDYAVQYKAKFNAHLGIALAGSTAGLKAATATVASTVVLTSADLLDGGEAVLLVYPRRINFTVAGGTPAHAPATASIVGTDYLDAAESTTAFAVPQTAATSADTGEAYKTVTTITYPAADGTGATVAVGYGQGVHDAVDSANLITATNPTYGLLKTGATWRSVTTPPKWAVGDLYTAGVDPSPATGAIAAIADGSAQFGMIVISEPVGTSDFATLVAGLNYALSRGKRLTLLCRFRDPAEDETDAEYITAFQTFALANQDDRIAIVAGSGWLTDAFRAYRYLRSGLPAVVARLQGNAAIGGKLGEKLAQHPGYVGRGALEGFSIVDDDDNLVGHDENQIGGIDDPGGGVGGGITFYRIPNPNFSGAYVSEAPVLHSQTSQILTLMDRRVANGIESLAVAMLWPEIQGADLISDTSPRKLDPDLRDGMSGKVKKGIADRYAREIQNADDQNLVVINEIVTVTGSQVAIDGKVNARLYPYTHDISLTFSASR